METADAVEDIAAPDAIGVGDTNDVHDEPVNDLREALNAAVEEHDPDEASEQAREGVTPQETDAPPQVTTSEATAQATDESAETPAPKNPARTHKPPASWDTKAREAWDTLPDSVKQSVAERERGMNMALQQTADARRVAKAFSDVVTPHQSTFQALGYQDPMQGLNQILQNVALLKNGSPDQRAQAAASVIRDFGIDVEKLDNVLAEGGVGAGAGTAHIEQLLDQRLQPVNTLMQQLEAAKYQQQQQQQHMTQNTVESFINEKEYGAQVRMEMADLLDMAAARGQNMTLEEAYDRACMVHPHIRESVVAQEREAQAAKAQQATQAKKTAASSVFGGPAGSGAPAAPNSISDALNQAWDLHAQR